MNRVVHFEIPADNLERATNFYKDVFGWNFMSYDENYQLARTGDGMGIDGAVMKKRDPNQPMVNSIEVPSVDEFAKKIEAAGGQMVVPKVAVGEMGYVAYFKDTEGNIHGIWETTRK